VKKIRYVGSGLLLYYVSMLKSISLTFRGFESSPQEVESMIGISAFSSGMKGQVIKPGFGGTFKRSAVKFSIDFPNGCRLDEMFPALMLHIGGITHVCAVRNKVSPEFLEVDIVLPIKKSKEQEGGFLSNESITAISELGATLSFQFLEK
jgi:hypothetical protein